jgi:hypothetical protein
MGRIRLSLLIRFSILKIMGRIRLSLLIKINTEDFKFQSDVVLIFGELVARKRILHLLPSISALSVHDGPA